MYIIQRADGFYFVRKDKSRQDKPLFAKDIRLARIFKDDISSPYTGEQLAKMSKKYLERVTPQYKVIIKRLILEDIL